MVDIHKDSSLDMSARLILCLGEEMLTSDLFRTPNKTKLGANAILGVSLAVAKAGAAEKVRCDNLVSDCSPQTDPFARGFLSTPTYLILLGPRSHMSSRSHS